MKVLVLGATGMLGHRLVRTLREHGVDTAATARRAGEADHVLDVRDAEAVGRVLDAERPDVVVNAAGVVKQATTDARTLVAINALFPHELAAQTADRGSRLVHVSTDCVFSGRDGGYSEDDVPDPVDPYGYSKRLGEPEGPGVLTLRTSFIGRELPRAGGPHGLLEWFLAAARGREPVTGFRRARWSGLTSRELSELIVRLVTRHPDVDGLLHAAGPPIDKHALLCLVREVHGLDVEIRGTDEPVVDRTLDAGRLREITGWSPPTWEEMLRDAD